MPDCALLVLFAGPFVVLRDVIGCACDAWLAMRGLAMANCTAIRLSTADKHAPRQALSAAVPDSSFCRPGAAAERRMCKGMCCGVWGCMQSTQCPWGGGVTPSLPGDKFAPMSCRRRRQSLDDARTEQVQVAPVRLNATSNTQSRACKRTHIRRAGVTGGGGAGAHLPQPLPSPWLAAQCVQGRSSSNDPLQPV